MISLPIIYHLQSFGDADVSGEELHDILKEIDTNMNGQVELDEYLAVRNFCQNILSTNSNSI